MIARLIIIYVAIAWFVMASQVNIKKVLDKAQKLTCVYMRTCPTRTLKKKIFSAEKVLKRVRSRRLNVFSRERAVKN